MHNYIKLTIVNSDALKTWSVFKDEKFITVIFNGHINGFFIRLWI